MSVVERRRNKGDRWITVVERRRKRSRKCSMGGFQMSEGEEWEGRMSLVGRGRRRGMGACGRGGGKKNGNGGNGVTCVFWRRCVQGEEEKEEAEEVASVSSDYDK